jgi:hypothetical protein
MSSQLRDWSTTADEPDADEADGTDSGVGVNKTDQTCGANTGALGDPGEPGEPGDPVLTDATVPAGAHPRAAGFRVLSRIARQSADEEQPYAPRHRLTLPDESGPVVSDMG